MVQAGLDGWERKMGVVGAIDDLGVTDALYKHLASLNADFDHVLVDEVQQDLGTLELRIIRAPTKPGPNDLFWRAMRFRPFTQSIAMSRQLALTFRPQDGFV